MMRSSVARRATALLLATALLFSVVSAQQQAQEESRPRRAEGQWPQPPAAPTPISLPALTSIAVPEPNIRVALSTNARSAVISSSSRLMNASGGQATMLALNTSRVRVEARLLSPAPVQSFEDNYRVEVGGAVSRDEALQFAKEVKKISDEDSQISFDTETKSWGLVVGAQRSLEEAEELQGRLEESGLAVTISKSGQPANQTAAAKLTNSSTIKLASRPSMPSREVVASTPTSTRLFSSSAPVSFASDDEQNAPVRFNDRPYRGRIEVFANLSGNLTVVNELPLEDYVRGVVANELSPGGYPAIEALKAQAVAARTYAYTNRGQFISQGFDVLPTTRSQVYRGLSSENPLSSRAVFETRGLIATYNGEPINALYTSTCGGRTESSENIFNDAVPYLRGRECAAEGIAAIAPYTIKTSREPAELRDAANVPFARDIGLLTIQNFNLPSNVSDSWFTSEATVSEIRNWLANTARVAKQVMPVVADDVGRPPAFASALASAVFGESPANTLLNDADVEYFLAVKDSAEIPAVNRADLAMLIRDGYFTVYPDATVRPRQPLTRGRALHAIARILEGRDLLQLQKGNARSTTDGQLILRSTKGKDQQLRVRADAFLFRQLGETQYGVKSVALVGGEAVMFHVGASGDVDYLEVKPALNGAAADRFSPFSRWSKGLSLGQVQARLGRAARGIGQLTDLRIASRGYSRRVTDLEVIGTNGTAHVRGGRIRSALGLREQLFVIEREYDNSGRVTEFVFSGRGWGHGVGMCQVGAYGLAKQGWSFEQILKAYYTGIEVTRMY